MHFTYISLVSLNILFQNQKHCEIQNSTSNVIYNYAKCIFKHFYEEFFKDRILTTNKKQTCHLFLNWTC